MVLRLKKLAARSGSSAALHRFIGHILLSVLSGNTCVLPTLRIVVWSLDKTIIGPQIYHTATGSMAVADHTY
jgi:hypothetical protein